MRNPLKRFPVLGQLSSRFYSWLTMRARRTPVFPGTPQYWEERYASGGNSGRGSYGELASFKAHFLNEFVERERIQSIIEFGCGDGNQLTLAHYPEYSGYDVSKTAVRMCRERFKDDTSKQFGLTVDYDGRAADLALSLDVIYHLVEDEVFDSYMRLLFDAATRYVVICSSDSSDNAGYEGSWIRQHRFTEWIAENAVGWVLKVREPNPYPLDPLAEEGSWSDFFVYEREAS